MGTNIHYAAFDPGQTTGWATFDDTGEVIDFGQVKGEDNLYELLNTLGLDFVPNGTFIIEKFMLYPWKSGAQFWSTFAEVQAIGAIKYLAWHHRAEVVEQPASILPIAYKWARKKRVRSHASSHQLDAYCHGVYYLIKKGVRRHAS